MRVTEEKCILIIKSKLLNPKLSHISHFLLCVHAGSGCSLGADNYERSLQVVLERAETQIQFSFGEQKAMLFQSNEKDSC